MSYDIFQPRVLPIFFYYIFLIIFSIFMTFKMFSKWYERRVPPPLYLSSVFLFFTIALIALAIGLAEAVITGYYKEIYRFSLPFSFSMVVIADIFIYKFACHITEKGKSLQLLIYILAVILIIMLFLPWNWWGVPSSDYEGQLNIRLYTTLSLIIYSCSIYIYISYISRQAKEATNDKVAKFGLKLLSYSMIMMILFFVMMVLDTVMIVAFDHPGYSEFVYIAWFFAILFYIFSYLSLVMPDWIVKRIKE
ncbi:MAG: hypothetical protein ACP6IY_10485 [Promethearchaeia archaeon]